MNFKQLATPLKVLAVVFGLGFVWIVYMAGFLSFPFALSPEQMQHVNGTKTAIAERWYILLRPGFTGTPTITRTPSNTPTPTLTGTITSTPSNTPTSTRMPYYLPPTSVRLQGSTSVSAANPTTLGPTSSFASSIPAAPTATPAQTQPSAATNTSFVPPTPLLPTVPLPTVPLPQPTQPPPAPTDAPTEVPTEHIKPTKEPKPTKTSNELIDLLNGLLGIDNNMILYHLLSGVPHYFR